MNEVIPAPVPAIVQVDLQTVARQLADAHDACCNATHQALHHALRAGDLLLMAKAECQHGEWLPWLDTNFPGSRRLAQRYMRLAKNRGAIVAKANTATHLTIDDAVQLLATPKPESIDDLFQRATTIVMPPEVETNVALAAFAVEHNQSIQAAQKFLGQAAEKIDSPDISLEELVPLLKKLEHVVNAQKEMQLRVERRLGQLVGRPKPTDDEWYAAWHQRADEIGVPECDGTKGYIMAGLYETFCQLWPSEKCLGAWYVSIVLPDVGTASGWAMDYTRKPVCREAVPYYMDGSKFVPQGKWQAIDSPVIQVEEYDWQKELAGRGQR